VIENGIQPIKSQLDMTVCVVSEKNNVIFSRNFNPRNPNCVFNPDAQIPDESQEGSILWEKEQERLSQEFAQKYKPESDL